MKLYKSPEMQTIEFDITDVITTSGEKPDIDGGSQEIPNTWITNKTGEHASIVVGW